MAPRRRRQGELSPHPPTRDAVLLIGGDKTGNDRFYDEMVPVADRLWEEYLREVSKPDEEEP